MRRVLALATAALLVAAIATPSALAHSAFVEATPAPGQRLAESPRQVTLSFTEPLNERLSHATLVGAVDGREVRGVLSRSSGKRLRLVMREPLMRGAFRLRWHTVSTVDGHALEGSYSFGVRAPAAGATHDVEQGPLARDGWVRVLARGLMYATLLVFAGAVGLDALLRRRGRLWLVPQVSAAGAPAVPVEVVERRYRRLVLDSGFLAAGAAVLSAVADAADAAGGFSAQGLGDFLLTSVTGLNRLYVVVFIGLALAGAALRVRAAALGVLAALASVALSGHANAVAPRWLAVFNDWAHLTATALWLGGIAVIVAVWGPVLRRSEQAERLAVARHVLPRFGRVALPAFAVVLVTGVVSAVIELGRLSALWDTDYGRVLAVKVALVAVIAGASYLHAFRLRPRLLAANPHPGRRLERRHWWLVRAEPLLGAGVVAAVALLVAFPLPPRQLGDADKALSAAPAIADCDGCPLPRPARGELAVAAQGGSNIVAAWVRPDGAAVAGTVRLYALDRRPARDPFTVRGATQRPCGLGCARFRLLSPSPRLRVAVRQRGRTYTATLPVRWRTRQSPRARRLVTRSQAVMRGLASVREVERVSSIPEIAAVTRYRLEAPNRMAFQTRLGVQSVAVGSRQWTRGQRGTPWQEGEFGGSLPFRFRSWFTWATYARHTYLLDVRRSAGRRVADVALMDPSTPTWWRLTIDLRSFRVIEDRMVTYGHFMTQRFFAFNRPLRIQPPETTRGR